MNGDINKVKAIQSILGMVQDGIWGPKSQMALDLLIRPTSAVQHAVIASSFADPADVKAFNLCKAAGGTDEECFKVGDNAIGIWGDSTAEGTGPSCALPPEDLEEKWGTVNAAKYKQVLVRHEDKEVVCILKDIMPHRAHLTTRARIDLNPDSVRTLGLEPPIMAPVVWKWFEIASWNGL